MTGITYLEPLEGGCQVTVALREGKRGVILMYPVWGGERVAIHINDTDRIDSPKHILTIRKAGIIRQNAMRTAEHLHIIRNKVGGARVVEEAEVPHQ
jgi:hypothetical protein